MLASGIAGAMLMLTTVAYRSAYGSWWQAPERISYCGRTYLLGTTDLSLADIQERLGQAGLSDDGSNRLAVVGKAPPIIGPPMLAVVTPEEERQKHGVPCTMALYLETGEDEYTAYGLSGGP